MVKKLIEDGSVEERARLSWFLLWNRLSFAGNTDRLLQLLSTDVDPTVRKSLSLGIRRLGLMTEEDLSLLNVLAGDEERAVRAAAGEALVNSPVLGRLQTVSGSSHPTMIHS